MYKKSELKNFINSANFDRHFLYKIAGRLYIVRIYRMIKILVLKKALWLSLLILIMVFVILNKSSFFHYAQKIEKQPDYDNDIEKVISSKVRECTEKNRSSICPQQAASFLVDNYEFGKIMSVFEKNNSQPHFFKSCHTFLHFIGREFYKRIKDVPRTISECSYTCFQGCHHGVLEGYFIEKNISLDNEEAIAKEAPTICGKKQDYANIESYNTCLHGLGHGFMFFTEEELPKSLKMCDSINAKDIIDYRMCYNGVFHENTVNLTSTDHPSKYINKDDPYYPCNILDKKYLEVCYHDQVSYVSGLLDHDLLKTIDFCKKVPADYQLGCFTAIGQKRATLTQDQNTIWKDCETIRDEKYIGSCVRGVVVENFALGKTNRNFCQAVQGKYKDICLSIEAEYQKRWGL